MNRRISIIFFGDWYDQAYVIFIWSKSPSDGLGISFIGTNVDDKDDTGEDDLFLKSSSSFSIALYKSWNASDIFSCELVLSIARLWTVLSDRSAFLKFRCKNNLANSPYSCRLLNPVPCEISFITLYKWRILLWIGWYPYSSWQFHIQINVEKQQNYNQNGH